MNQILATTPLPSVEGHVDATYTDRDKQPTRPTPAIQGSLCDEFGSVQPSK